VPFLVNIKKRRNGAQPYFHAIRFIDCGEIVKGFGMLLGKEKGVVVALENLRRVGNISYLVDRYEDRSCVRFCYDSGHEHGYTVYASFPDIFRDRIICTHIHDNLGLEHNPENPDLHLLPFEGNINYKDMMKRLHKYSYQGPLSLEVWTGKRYADRAPDEFLRDCYKRIKKISKM